MKVRSRRAGRSRERGSAAGAVVFALVLAGIMIGGYLWLQGRREAAANGVANGGRTVPAEGAADKWTRLLGKFLAKGPQSGTWQTKFLSCTYRQYVAPHPTEADMYLLAHVKADGPPKTRALSRWLVPRQFFRAPASLFFSNYRRSRAPEPAILSGMETVRVHWRPRADAEGLTETERVVWFSVAEGTVVQVEDRSRTGVMVRRVTRISTGTDDWDPAAVDAKDLTRSEGSPPDPHADPDLALEGVVARAPFPVYVPKILPPGFVLVRASYSVIQPAADEDDEQEAPLHLVSQLYSDGLALISVGIAPRGDMNVIEMMATGMDDGADPASCPGLPTDPRDIRHNGTVIRLRTDTCRTVVRRDDLPTVSVTLIGRNELPVEEYLRMMGTLESVK